MDLLKTPFLFFDGQTTGWSANRSQLLEVGWSLSFDEKAIETRLIRPTEIEEIPKKVWTMTGISPTQLEVEEADTAVWKEFTTSVRRSAMPPLAMIIHYAQFELPFLTALQKKVYGDVPLPWLLIDTYRLALRLCSDLPAKTIRAMSGNLGFVLPQVNRARDHVAATQKIWASLLEILRCRESVTTWDELQIWLTKPKEKRLGKKLPRKYLFAREARLALPEGPGIYEMFSTSGKPLYIGKAKSLRSRVNSYFTQKRSKRSRLHELMTQVGDICVTPTETALEAALLENDRIKEVNPPYNVSLRVRGHELIFVSHDLSCVSGIADEKHPWGPFTREPFDSTEQLLYIQKEQTDLIEELWLIHPKEEIKEKLEIVLKGLGIGFTNLTFADLLSAGKRLLPSPLPENEVEASVHRKLKRAGRRLHRARWISELTESRICWQISGPPNSQWRMLTIEKGQIKNTDTLTAAEAPRGVKLNRGTLRDRQNRIDRKTYDRMRILLTELSTITKRGISVQIAFSPTRHIELPEPERPSWLTRVLKEVPREEPSESTKSDKSDRELWEQAP